MIGCLGDIRSFVIDETLVFGFDVGMATCAVAYLMTEGGLPEPSQALIRWWPMGETKGESPRAEYGRFRRTRRCLHRRRLRLRKARAVLAKEDFAAEGPLTVSGERRKHLEHLGLRGDVYGLRALAVRGDGALSRQEWAAVILHCIVHRGWQASTKFEVTAGSNRPPPKKKSKEGEEDKNRQETRKVLDAIRGIRARMVEGGFRTLGEMLGQQKIFALPGLPDLPEDRRRNTTGEYSFVAPRELMIEELRILCAAVSLSGDATQGLVDLCRNQDAGKAPSPYPCKLLGADLGKGGEDIDPAFLRSHANHPSFEAFRFLQGLNNLAIVDSRNGAAFKLGQNDKHPPSAGLMARIVEMRQRVLAFLDHPDTGKLTYAGLRKLLKLEEHESFAVLMSAVQKAALKKEWKKEAVPPDFIKKEQKRQESDKIFADLSGTRAFCELFGPAVLAVPERIDELARILLDTDNVEAMRRDIDGLMYLDDETRRRIENRLDLFDFPRSRGHLCPRAARMLAPHLRDGLDYRRACEAAGLKEPEAGGLDDIFDHTVRLAVENCRDVFVEMVRRLGRLPGRIVVETGRELAKSAEVRDRWSRERNDNEKRVNALADAYRQEVGEGPPRGFAIRCHLWEEQGGICPYCGHGIELKDLGPKGGNPAQVDHILYKAGLRDSRRLNLVLTHAGCNQNKGDRPAFAFIAAKGEAALVEYRGRIGAMRLGSQKKKRLLAESHEKFLREIGEADLKPALSQGNSWVAKALMTELRKLYADRGTRRVYASVGATTALLRNALGVNDIKYGRDQSSGRKVRLQDDRTHGVDAMMLALVAVSPSRITHDIAREMQRCGRDSDSAYDEDEIHRQEIAATQKTLRLALADAGCSALADIDALGRHIRTIWEEFSLDRRYGRRKVDGALHKQTCYGYECFTWMPLDQALPILAGKPDKGEKSRSGLPGFDGLMKTVLAEAIPFPKDFSKLREVAGLQAELITHIRAEIAARLDGLPVPDLPDHLAGHVKGNGKPYRKQKKTLVLAALPVKVPQRPGDPETGQVVSSEEDGFVTSSSVNLIELHAQMVAAAQEKNGKEAIRKKWEAALASLRDIWRNKKMFDVLKEWCEGQEQDILRFLAEKKDKEKGEARKDQKSSLITFPVLEEKMVKSFAVRESLGSGVIIPRGDKLVLAANESILAVILERGDGLWKMTPVYRMQAKRNAQGLPAREESKSRVVLFPGDLVEIIDHNRKERIGYLQTVDMDGKRLYLLPPLNPKDIQKVGCQKAHEFHCLRPVAT